MIQQYSSEVPGLKCSTFLNPFHSVFKIYIYRPIRNSQKSVLTLAYWCSPKVGTKSNTLPHNQHVSCIIDTHRRQRHLSNDKALLNRIRKLPVTSTHAHCFMLRVWGAKTDWNKLFPCQEWFLFFPRTSLRQLLCTFYYAWYLKQTNNMCCIFL